MSTELSTWDLPSDHDRLAEYVVLSGSRVVDVGAGAGALVRFARAQGADALGVECGEAMISQARDLDPDHADSYIDGVGQDLPLDDASADVVVFCYSLHHVPAEHMATALVEVERVLRPGGELVVMEPVPEGPSFETHRLVDDETEVRALAQAAVDAHSGSLTETGTYRYATSFSYADMAELEKVVVDIDPTRRAAFDAVRAEVTKRFFEHGEAHEGRYWFRQPVLMRMFTKAS